MLCSLRKLIELGGVCIVAQHGRFSAPKVPVYCIGGRYDYRRLCATKGGKERTMRFFSLRIAVASVQTGVVTQGQAPAMLVTNQCKTQHTAAAVFRAASSCIHGEDTAKSTSELARRQSSRPRSLEREKMVWSLCWGWLYSIALRDEVHSSEAAHCSPAGEHTIRRSRRSGVLKLLLVKLHTWITATLAETKVQANSTAQMRPWLPLSTQQSNRT